jgi:hypothetical protein
VAGSGGCPCCWVKHLPPTYTCRHTVVSSSSSSLAVAQ